MTTEKKVKFIIEEMPSENIGNITLTYSSFEKICAMKNIQCVVSNNIFYFKQLHEEIWFEISFEAICRLQHESQHTTQIQYCDGCNVDICIECEEIHDRINKSVYICDCCEHRLCQYCFYCSICK